MKLVAKDSILIVLPWDPMLPGGVSIVVRNLARVWSNAGVVHKLLISDWGHPRYRPSSTETPKFRLAILGRISVIGVIKALLVAPFTMLRTNKILNDAAVTGVCFHYPSLDALGTLILKRFGIFRGRVALCFHGTDVRTPPNVLEAKLWRWMFANADGITACSKSLSAEIHRVFGVPESRIQVAYNGVDTEIFVPLLETDSREANFAGKYIVSVGSFIPRKGHRFLLEAYANFVRTHPDVGLVIVGGDGEVLATLQDWIDVQGLSGCVTLLVDLPPQAVANVVKGASICVQPSLAEPFGMAVIEAGACGILVAASAVGGHVELIEHEKTGLLFPPADTDAIEKILEARFSEVNRFEQIATTFRNQILQRFTWESCTAQYRSVLAKAEAITVAHASRQSISACAESAGLKGNRISLDTACTESHIKPPK